MIPKLGGPNWQETFHRRRACHPGDMQTLRKRLWLWLGTADRLLKDAVARGDLDMATRALHAANQISVTYIRAAEADAAEARAAGKKAVGDNGVKDAKGG